MIPTIAGRKLQIGDSLYHTGLLLWGTVLEVTNGGTAIVEFKAPGVGNARKFTMTDGGVINGKRMLYWHKPLELDRPYGDISAFQRLVDLAIKDGKEYGR